MDAYQPPPQYMRPPSGPPPPADPYHQYYQHQARPPVPPTQPGGPPAWYSNQFHNPHSPSPPPPPPQQWGPPSSHFPQGQPYSSPAYPPHHLPFNAGANGNSQFRPPPSAGPPLPPPYPQANQEWGNPNWGYQQGQNSQGNSNVEDWAVKAKEWAAANKDQQPQSAPHQPNGQVYQQQYATHSYQDAHQQAAPELIYQQQLPVPSSTQLEIYPNYSTGNESFPGGSSTGLSHQQNLPTSSAIHQQEVPYSYSSVSGKEESGNARQHEVPISVPDGGGSARTEQLIQYAYGDQTTAPPSNLSDQHIQFSTRENSDYTNVHNAWQPHSTTGVVYPPIPSSVPSISHHDSSMAIPPVSGHTMPPYGTFPPSNLQPVGPPYSFGTKPPLHPGAAFMDDSYAASTVTPKKAPVPNWLKEELLKKKADLGRPSLESMEERVSMDDDVLYKPPVKADERDKRSFSPSKSSDEEEEDEDEMDAARTTAINMEIKRILTEVLLKVTDELFDEIAIKVINEDEVIPEDDRIQHSNQLSSSLISTADPLHKASTKILVSVEGANKNANSASPADVLGLASYASDDDDADTDAVSNADADGYDGVESLGMGSRYSVSQQPSLEKLPEAEAMANAKMDTEVEVNANSGNHCKSGPEDYSPILDSRRKEDEAGRTKISVVSPSSGLDNNTSGTRKKHPDRTESDKDAILDEPHRKNSGLMSDCNLHRDSNKTYGKDLRDDVSSDRSRPDETKSGKEKVDSQNGSKDRMKQDLKLAEKLKGVESNKKSADPHVKKDSRDVERPRRTNSKEDRGKKREKEKEEERPRRRKAEDSSKDKRRRSPTSNESSDDSIRKSRSRRRNVSPSPVRSRRKRPSPSSDESSDDSRRKSSSRRRNRSPSPGRSRRRHVSSRSPHSKHSQHKHTLYSSHNKSRSKRSRSRSPRRRHRAK